MNASFLFWTLLTMTAIAAASEIEEVNYNATVEVESDQPSKLLSRRKRFLVFPDGSSFQLVFCAQNHGYLQIGNIVWFGNTAALAWELPSDPQLYYMLKKESKFYDNRRQDTNKHVYYLDEDGKVLSKVPYKRRPIVNPAFAKRSIRGDTPEVNKLSKSMSIKELHIQEKKKDHFQDLDEGRIEFHRQNRKDVYGKIEKVLESLGWNGHECVLRLLCETGKHNDKQGTFLEEIVKATFTLPRGRGFESRLRYDVAHGTEGDCSATYPDCKLSIM